MTNAFQLLGLPARLTLADESVAEAYREAGRRLHPDAGGADGEFAALREAHAILSSPSRRLLHWLELRGGSAAMRGSIAAELMDLFSEVGEVMRQAESVIRRREAAKSALGRALVENDTQSCREAVSRALERVEAGIGAIRSEFGRIEHTSAPDEAEVGRAARDLAFLEKWRAGLRACFGRLV